MSCDDFHNDQTPVVIIADRSDDATEAARLAGRRIAMTTDWQSAPQHLAQRVGRAVLLVEATGVGDDILVAVLPAIERYAATAETAVIACFTEAQIDVIAAGLAGPQVQLLCEPSMAERVAALAMAEEAGRSPAGVHDITREPEASRLQRLNEEVARIAEVLSRLTRDEPSRPADDIRVSERRMTFATQPAEGTSAVTGAEVRQAIRSRRMRDQFFGRGLFEDPGWDMLLDLFAAELERAQVSVSSLCIAAAVAPTTALRWIGKLTNVGLLERRPDPFDRRRAFMVLSETARTGMIAYCQAVRKAGLAIA